MRRLLALACGVALASVAAPQSPFGRLDRQKEIELGREAYDDLLAFGRISKNQAYIQRVNRVFDTLLAVMPEKEYPYQVVVVAEETVNAFCLPGGYIAVYEGLIARVPDDDALAFVLAHEIGHASNRHWVRQSRKSQGDILFGMLLGDLIGTIYVNLSRLSHTRQHESEADRYAVGLYVKAGYDPADAAESMRLFAKMDEKKRNKLPPYLQSHPSPRGRVEAIEKEVKQAVASGVASAPPPSLPALDARLYGALPEVPIASNPWFPTIPGSEWEYAVEGPGTGRYRLRCISAGDSGRGVVARFEQVFAGRTVSYQALATADSVWRRNRPELESSGWQVETVFPQEGAEPRTAGSWQYAYAGTETLTTPAGRFADCLKVQAKDGTRELTLWYAPQVGLVRRLNEKAGVDEKLVRFTRGAS
ncbi:MAG TPA: M48 family metalloprotease [Fimbriimonas sp.]